MFAMSHVSRKTTTAGLAALALAGTMAMTTTEASAGWRHRHHGGAIAAGIVGGMALGALVASRPAYAEPVYVEAAPACYKVRKQVWSDYHGGYVVRRVTVCD